MSFIYRLKRRGAQLHPEPLQLICFDESMRLNGSTSETSVSGGRMNGLQRRARKGRGGQCRPEQDSDVANRRREDNDNQKCIYAVNGDSMAL
jgi:hypothetical protein